MLLLYRFFYDSFSLSLSPHVDLFLPISFSLSLSLRDSLFSISLPTQFFSNTHSLSLSFHSLPIANTHRNTLFPYTLILALRLFCLEHHAKLSRPPSLKLHFTHFFAKLTNLLISAWILISRKLLGSHSLASFDQSDQRPYHVFLKEEISLVLDFFGF